MAKENLKEEETFNANDVKAKGDYIRAKILENISPETHKTAPNIFDYVLHKDSIGLNEVSNVDMGYACTTVSNDGVNMSKRNPYLNELEYNVSLMNESDNAILFLNGGLFTYIPKTRANELLSYESQIAYFYSLFKDLAKDGKIVAMVRGTEEHRILKNHQIDVMGILQEALGLKGKVCNEALVNVTIEDDIVGKAPIGIRTINWNNSATTGAYIGRKMEERATKRGGADIYVARTTMNYFKSSLVGESTPDGKDVIMKPIYMISSGSYTPFKGAMTAGAEYNSIKDGELCPPLSWYKVTVEPKQKEDNGRDYVVRVNPINYVAHQVLYQGTDKVTDRLERMISESSDSFVQKILDKYPSTMALMRDNGRKNIRNALLENKEIAKTNSEIAEYLNFKDGRQKSCEPNIEDLSTEDLSENNDTQIIRFDGEDLQK